MLLRAEELVVHHFVAIDGPHASAAVRSLLRLWHACGERAGMTAQVPGVPFHPGDAPLSRVAPGTRLLAGRTRPDTGDGVYEAVLHQVHDVLCLSAVLCPAPATGLGWPELLAQWQAVTGQGTADTPRGLLGTSLIFLARLSAPQDRPSAAPGGPQAQAVEALLPVTEPTVGWPERGTDIPQGFAVWEASAADDARVERRFAVLGAARDDVALSNWAWLGPGRVLPPFAKYLLHAAKLRYQLRVWDDGRGTWELRQEMDTALQALLETVMPGPDTRDPNQEELVRASRDVVALQARELGLVNRSTRLRELWRGVEIAIANLSVCSDDPDGRLSGAFADDRGLAAWFAARLDDEMAYVEATLQRCAQISRLTDQLVQRSRQRRQESINLGLTGAIGAILMSLAAVQSLEYSVPLPSAVKPAVVAVLAAFALLASMVVVRTVVPDRNWSLFLVGSGAGVLAAALSWLTVSVVAGDSAGPRTTWLSAGAGLVIGVLMAMAWRRLRK
ncbi:hypothetical protein ADK70_29925 [Streptomyces rimosus subsp. pseudoverticillatus]|nr:hypothetical protein ADK70_29925 [Streptomyces rimosus subsp. pseudoverticillatus]